jgi:hypothetical protein
MIKQFVYNVAAYVQNKLNGEQSVISQQYIGEVEITETSYIVEFAIADDKLINYIIIELDNWLLSNSLTYDDIDITKFIVNSEDPDVSIYFEQSDSNQIIVDTPIIAWIQGQYENIPVPSLTGEVINFDTITWSWDIIENCSYIIRDTEDNIIATVGLGLNTFTEFGLQPGTNYTRNIQAFDGENYSEKSPYITKTTEDLWNPSSTELPEFENKSTKDINLSLVDENPLYSPLFKSGIGEGDDCLVEIDKDNKEEFDISVKVKAHDILQENLYKEKAFQYRQKAVGKIDRESKFGKFEGNVYTHLRDQYNFSINADVYAPLAESKNINISLETKATGYAVKDEYFKYELNCLATNQEVNLTRYFEFILNVEYDTSYSFNYRIKREGSTGNVIYSDWIYYENLKSYNNYTDINYDDIVTIMGNIYPREELSVEVEANKSHIISVIVDEDGYLLARNIIPDNYNSDFVVYNNIKTITDAAGKIILTGDDLKSYKPMNNLIEYTGEDYENFKYTIKDISNIEVNLSFSTSGGTTIYGLEDIMANTNQFFNDYTLVANIQDRITTPLFDNYNTKFISPSELVLNLLTEEYPTDDNQDIVENTDRLYIGDNSNIALTLNLIEGNVTIEWETSLTSVSDYTDNIMVTSVRTEAEYKYTYPLYVTIPEGSSGQIILVNSNEIENYKPYYNGIKWPFSVSEVTYTIIGDYDNIELSFDNNLKHIDGPANIYGLLNYKTSLYTKKVDFGDYIYDYEFINGPKILGNKFNIIPVNSSGEEYTGDLNEVIYSIINYLPRQNVSIDEDGNIGISINTPKPKRLLRNIDSWYNSNPKTIDFRDYDHTAHYSIEKTGGHNNTIALWNDNSTVLVKNIDDISYSTNGVLYLYAIKEEITLEEVNYSQWKLGIINEGNIQSSLIVPLQDLSKENVYDTINEFEFSPEDGINYEIQGSNVTIYSDVYENQNVISEPVGIEILGNESDFTIYNQSKLLSIPITIDNPKIVNPGKYYTLYLESNNPNISLELSEEDFDINNLDDGPTIEVLVNASILIQNQTEWHPVINPGYYYLFIKENYLYGNCDINVDLIEENLYRCEPRPLNGRVLLTDEDGVPMTEVFDGIEIEETVSVENFKYIEATYTNIDLLTLLINNDPVTGAFAVNNTIILPNNINDDTINIKYKVKDSYHIEYFNTHIEIKTFTSSGSINVYYETGDKRKIDFINLNPLRNSNNSGFLYIKE